MLISLFIYILQKNPYSVKEKLYWKMKRLAGLVQSQKKVSKYISTK